jgi:hypothetical protein
VGQKAKIIPNFDFYGLGYLVVKSDIPNLKDQDARLEKPKVPNLRPTLNRYWWSGTMFLKVGDTC